MLEVELGSTPGVRITLLCPIFFFLNAQNISLHLSKGWRVIGRGILNTASSNKSVQSYCWRQNWVRFPASECMGGFFFFFLIYLTNHLQKPKKGQGKTKSRMGYRVNVYYFLGPNCLTLLRLEGWEVIGRGVHNTVSLNRKSASIQCGRWPGFESRRPSIFLAECFFFPLERPPKIVRSRRRR
jgi:hypothetical protein